MDCMRGQGAADSNLHLPRAAGKWTFLDPLRP